MDNPSLMSHVSIGVRDFNRAVTFYDTVLATIGAGRAFEHEGAVAYGHAFPEFWVHEPLDEGAPGVGNGTHFAFTAPDRASVDAFYDAALKAGAAPDGAPGPRPQYGAPYYGCFVRDLDGHKIEAVFWDAGMDGG